jgi:hypothetical protein
MRIFTILALLLTFGASTVDAAAAVELRGSRLSMERQNQVALDAGYTFARTFEDIDRMLATGELVELHGDENYDLREGIRSNAARPEVRVFIERLAAEYHAANGEKLIVTSLTRPASSQPGNASALSVHPTGMSIDLRVSQLPESRQWIEQHLLGMEADGLLDVTREYHPPHYHLALFPEAYMAHLEAELGADAVAALLAGEQASTEEMDGAVDGDLVDGRQSIWSRIAVVFGLGRS